MGEYTACTETWDSVLRLLASEDTGLDKVVAAKQKILMRNAKAALHALQLDQAENALEQLPASKERMVIRQCARQLRSNQANDAKAIHTKLILELPRYKPMIRNVPEYFTFGHDTPESMWEFHDELLHTDRRKISFLFAGIGDARNLHRTILSIAMQDLSKSDIKDSGKCFHFTVNDHKPAVIARDILILLMLDELAKYIGDEVKGQDEMMSSGVLPCLYYTYLAPIMPKLFYDILQCNIRKAIRVLEGDANFPQDCVKQEAFYLKTGVLFLDMGMEKLLGDELNAAYQTFDEAHPRSPTKALVQEIESTWRTNVTFVDLEWQRNREGWDGLPSTEADHMDIDVAHNPFELAIKLVEVRITRKSAKGLFYRTFDWFHSVARAMNQLQGRYKIEACVGDVIQVLEQIKYGIVGHRESHEDIQVTAGAESGPQATLLTSEGSQGALEDYPVAYDRIHLSNIPDYIGGTLSSFMHALPVTYPGKASYITACCLRNPPRFRTPAHFNNEYIGLSAPSDLKKLFHTRMQPLDFPDDMPLLALPKDRPARDFVLIYSPLNLTAFIRLCSHLHGMGYPAHWIGGVLSSILSGSITTKARPPRSEPLKIREVRDETSNAVLEQCTAPFRAEMSTLVSLWQQAGALPFGFLSPDIADVGLVHKYSVTFDEVPDIVAETPSFVLLLFDAGLLPPRIESLRPYLLSDEKADKSPRAQAVRERGLHILSVWDWHRSSKTASFWLRKDILERRDASSWGLSIWRTDNWISHGMPQRLSDVRDLGVWIDEGQ